MTTDYQCSKCKHRTLMPDGSFWCGLTMKPVGKGFLAHCPNFEFGKSKLYELKPQETPKQEARKIEKKEVKPKEVKPKEIKAKKPLTKKAKAKPIQQRKLF